MKYIPPNWRNKYELLIDSNAESKKESNDRVELFDEVTMNEKIRTIKMIEGENNFCSKENIEKEIDEIDYETLPFNHVEDINELLDRTMESKTRRFPPKPSNHRISRPNCPNPFAKPFDIASIIEDLLKKKENTMKPRFRFDISEEAAAHNWKIFESYDLSLDEILKNDNSIMRPGSEMKRTSELDKLFYLHPRWKYLRNRLVNGVDFYTKELRDEVRLADLRAAFIRGNHKSAKTKNCVLEKFMSKEIKKGWNIILPVDTYGKIPGLVLNPMGVATHTGVTKDGTFEEKDRVTHDLSFPGKVSTESVNSRVDATKLEPCMFSHVLLRLIHYIVNLRTRYPQSRIWLRKEDYKSAFRRLHLNAKSALESAIVVTISNIQYLIISLRMPFGGAPCPSEFALFTDIVTDTINDLLEDKNWNNKINFSDTYHHIPEPVYLNEKIPFAQAKKMCVKLPVEDNGKADVFLDDIISCVVDLNDNLDRITKAPSTVIDAVARQGKSMDVERDNMIEIDKAKAEGAAEEIKIVLGWTLETRRLLISLPKHKFIAWSSQIDSILENKSVSNKSLMSILGRLENVAQILVMLGHFLSNIRHLQILAEKKNHNIRLNTRSKLDLMLAKKFLKIAHVGVSLNLLTFRKPDKIYICDAAEYGLGGFASHGRAWTYIIPDEVKGRAHINILEYLAQVVSIWLDIIENKTDAEDCLLCMGDNTSAMGWLRRSNFRQKDENDCTWLVKQQIGRHLASIILDSNVMLYHQWLKGSQNQVADSLSRDAYYLNPNTHKKFLLATVPQQLPKNFEINPLPKEITCWLLSMLRKLPKTELWLKQQNPSELAVGNIGTLTWLASESKMSSLQDFLKSYKTQSYQGLHKRLDKAPSLQEIINNWLKEQSQPPSHMWHRPSGQTTGKTPDWTEMARLAIASQSN